MSHRLIYRMEPGAPLADGRRKWIFWGLEQPVSVGDEIRTVDTRYRVAAVDLLDVLSNFRRVTGEQIGTVVHTDDELYRP